MDYAFFLAHASPDKPWVEGLRDALKARGLPVFYDKDDLPLGADWDRSIPEAQRRSWATVVCVSARYDDAWYLRDEVTRAIERMRRDPDEHRVLPVYIEGLPADPRKVPYGLANLQGRDGKALGHESLAEELARLAEAAGWSRVAPAVVAPAPLLGGAEPPPPATEIHDRLCRLAGVRSLFDRVFDLLDAPRHEFSDHSPAATARDLVTWAELGGPREAGDSVVRRLVAAIDTARQGPAHALAGAEDRRAWQDLLAGLEPPQRLRLHTTLGLAADLPSPHGVPAEWAAALVRLMGQNERVYAVVDEELKREQLFTPEVRLARWRRVLLEENRGVPIIGFSVGVQYQLPIRDVYVPVHMHWGEGRDADSADPALARSGDQPIKTYLAELERRRRAGEEERGLAVIGEPGSGKTTLVRHLLSEVLDRGSESVGLPLGFTPVLLRFSRLARLADPGSPAGALRRMIEAEAEFDGHPGAGEALVAADGRLLVLLDGLDEVRERADLDRVGKWLCREVAHWPDARFVLTCRPPAWGLASKWLESRFLRLDVRRFKMPEARDYVGNWFRCVLRREAPPGATEASWQDKAAASAEALSSVLDERKVIGDMGRNPLLLSVICLVQHKRGRLPDSRAQLYEHALQLLLTDWALHREQQVPYQPDQAMEALAPLAWALQDREVTDHGTATEVDRDEAVRLVAGTLEQLPALARALGPDAHEAAEAFLDHVRKECGVLVESNVATLRFAHLTFQEYLAAKDAVRRQTGGVVDERGRTAAEDLAARAGDGRWEEPILLAMGLGLFPAFMRAVLASGSLPDQDLLRSCLAHSGRNDQGPFAEWLQRAGEPPRRAWWRQWGLGNRPVVPAADIVRVLQVCAGEPSAAVRGAAAKLVGHPDAGVASLARRVAGLEAEPAPLEDGRRIIEAGGLRVELVRVPPGRFERGSPRHTVTLTRGFWLGRFPVTNAQYRAFVRDAGHEEPESFTRPGFEPDEHPVAGTSWFDAQKFCAWLTKHLGGNERAILPTEAEWEWAARGGPEQGNPDRTFPWGDEAPDHTRAWFDDGKNAPTSTAAVGGRPAGAGPFGAEEQAGNVWEWCEDLSAAYEPGDVVDPCRSSVDKSTAGSSGRVLRGGSWVYDARYLRCGGRDRSHPEYRSRAVGFRVVVRGPPARPGSYPPSPPEGAAPRPCRRRFGHRAAPAPTSSSGDRRGGHLGGEP